MKTLRQSNSGFVDSLLHRIEGRLPSDKLLLRALFFGMVFSGVWLLFSMNQQYSSVTPILGGTLNEGIIGTPRFINPALAISRADQDVTALVYDSLMKIGPDGTLVNDAAESITVSEDGLTYNIVLRKDIRFHDDRPLTARDVIFTIQLIQNPDLKSPLRGNWTDVTIEEVNEYELNVVLEDTYAPFKENFLVGIMPAHLWSNLSIEQIPFSVLNTAPIGAGQFYIKTTIRDTTGLVETYILNAHKANPNTSNIETILLQFFSDEASLLAAVNERDVDATAYISNENISTILESGEYRIISEPLPRIFGIFFNQNRSGALRDPAVREALTLAIDKESLVANGIFGQGVPIDAPVIISNDTIESLDSSNSAFGSTSIEQAKQILKDAGWIENNVGLLEKSIDGSSETLVITLRTSNVPLFDTITKTIVDQWKAVGAEVVTEQFEQTGLVQSVIRPRDFQALLFGLDMSRSQDLYPFWHSSQKDSPGLNIAQYTNLTVDELLEQARVEQDSAQRMALLQEASEIIQSERPAIFLYQPNMTYVVKNELIVSDFRKIGRPSDRFSNINQWYTDSDTLWNIFKEDNQNQ
jgi:peptide/nickel transport system substrate-binding protein